MTSGDDPKARKGAGEDDRAADPQAPPANAQEAVERARQHALAAFREVLAALQALLDAASLTISGEPSEAHRLLGPISGILERLATELNGEFDRDAAALLDAISDALDAEIARWEDRADDDVEARAVLRAFIGLRELLWEFGVRREPGSGKGGAASRRTPRKAGRPSPRGRKKARVQRVPVEG